MAYFCELVVDDDPESGFEHPAQAFERARQLAIAEALHDNDEGEDEVEEFDESAWLAGNYDCGTIAAKAAYVVVRGAEDPADLPTAQRLAAELADTHPQISDETGPAGAIAVLKGDGTRGWLYFGNATT
ncbi:hypothetical protein [Nocardia sp. XZ_19_369]|uniref:hypothetical protein n=1 Tax=Nocardia sp. XZ_19_369 TaxID=2769487 RepID=UPI00188F3022|nr:hypothetical protein [Nocardia sp. XZ_19_369]